MTAADLLAEYRATLIAALPLDTPDVVIEELSRGLDVVIKAHQEEARGPAVTGDARDRLEALLVASYGEVSDMDAFVSEMSRYGVVVLGKGDYDELRKGGLIAAAYVLDRADQYRNDSASKVALEELVDPLARGEHVEAFRHGELDDLMPRVTRVSPRRKP